MRNDNFEQLRAALLAAGIAPGHVRRTLLELQEHFDDIVDAAVASGCDPDLARQNALREIGDHQAIVNGMRECPELLSWPRRFPYLAIVVYPLTCLAILPAVPVLVGVAHTPVLARWSMSLLFAGLVTASLLLLMQLSILLT